MIERFVQSLEEQVSNLNWWQRPLVAWLLRSFRKNGFLPVEPSNPDAKTN